MVGATMINGLNTIYNLYGTYNPSNPVEDDIPGRGMQLGTHIHRAVETNGEYIKSLVVEPYTLFKDITTYEKKVLKLIAEGSMSDVEAYASVYKSPLKGLNVKDITPDLVGEVIKTTKKVNVIKTKGKEYLLFDKTTKERNCISISQEEYDIITKCYEALHGNQEAKYWFTLKSDEDNGLQVNEELPIIWKYENYDFVIKSMIDKIIIDHLEKEVIIIDLKTHSKAPGEFVSSYRHWRYFSQLSLYREAVKSLYPDYDIICYIVPISTKYFVCSDPIRISDRDLDCGKHGGFIKPDWFTNYNSKGEVEVFLKDEQVRKFIEKGWWEYPCKNQFQEKGWLTILEEYSLLKQKENGKIN